MRIIIQRVKKASVEIEKEITASIQEGVLVLIGITHTDTETEAKWLANKLVNLRIFADQEGKINRSLLEEGKEALLVSQFTLYASCTDGRRPSFIEAAPPEKAKPLYEKFVAFVQETGIQVSTGVFGADMAVSLVNDGPITLFIEKQTDREPQSNRCELLL